jgi:hypothetical protein
VPHAALLVRFTEALISGSDAALEAARFEVMETLGGGALVDAAAVSGAFEGYTRIADAIGIPTETVKIEMTEDFRAGLGADSFTGAQNLGPAPVRPGAESAFWGPARVK